MINELRFGIELFKEYSKNKEVKKALNDNLYREIRFNIEMLDQIDKNKDNTVKLIGLLRTSFYDYLKGSLLDIELIVENKDITIKSQDVQNKNFLKWSKDIKTRAQLIERLYLRIDILKALSTVEITKRKDSYRYVKFLILLLKREIDND